MKPRTIIFPHVPKSGGTSLKVQIERSGLNTFMDYDATPGVSKWLHTNCTRRNEEFRHLDFSNFDLVFGHFPIERYLCDDDRYQYVALVRDPYSRIVSQLKYLFYRAKHVPNAEPSVRALAKLFESGELTPSDWVRKHGAWKMYQQYLAYWPRSRFTLVGDTSRYQEFTDQLNELAGIQIDPSVRERETIEVDFHIPADEEDRVRALLGDEYRWYDAFVGKS